MSIKNVAPSVAVLDLKKIELTNYIEFNLTHPQFTFFEQFCSGSKFSGDWEQGLKFLIERQERLMKEYAENEESYGEYRSFYTVCQSYWDENFLSYETTSGSILSVINKSLVETTNHQYVVLLPKCRVGGSHHRHLILALAGMTPDIWTKEVVEGELLSQPYYTGEIPMWMEATFRFYAEKFQYPLDEAPLEELAEEISAKVYAERL